ncbi:MAG: Rne/Rng family ribonuclease [Gammaproteobacteria bacterium]|nr:Rne/Rng family ribonuclease [Gammaproteobacteria bacterium]
MKRILINGTYSEEIRVAIVNGRTLFNLYIGPSDAITKVGNIYKGVITKVEHSLDACFVSYSQGKQGFLPFKQISDELLHDNKGERQLGDSKPAHGLQEGMEVIVQVDKDERGEGAVQKGATLTTIIALPGNYFVLRPNNQKSGGISRTIEAASRADVRENLKQLDMDSKHALIARTESAGKTVDELQWDLDFLTRLWNLIEQAANSSKAPFLIYKQDDLITQTLRDHLGKDVEELIVDDEEIYERIERYIRQVMPDKKVELKLHRGKVPLFTKYKIQDQVNSVFNRKINLPSGGYLIFDSTEALLSVDVNSGKATKGAGMEETALQTNLEAVEMLADQLRLRDHGGLIVADLIDMSNKSNRALVVRELKSKLRVDRAKTLVGGISEFGLLEMSRQRLRTSLADTNHHFCDKCHGTGLVQTVEASTISLLRRIEESAYKPMVSEVQCRVPTDIAIYLVNEMNPELDRLRLKFGCKIVIVPEDNIFDCEINVKTVDYKGTSPSEDQMSFEIPHDSRVSNQKVKQMLRQKDTEKAVIGSEHMDLISSPKPQNRAGSEQQKSGFLKFVSGLMSPFKSDETTGKKPSAKQGKPPAKTKKQTKAAGVHPQAGQQKRKQATSAGQKQQSVKGKQKQQASKPQQGKQASGKKRDGANIRPSQGVQAKNRPQGDQGRTKREQKPTSPQQDMEPDANAGNPRIKTMPADSQKPKPENPPQEKANQGSKSKPVKQGVPRKPQSPRNRNTGQKPKQHGAHVGVIVSVEDIPEDIPDDIGNRI